VQSILSSQNTGKNPPISNILTLAWQMQVF